MARVTLRSMGSTNGRLSLSDAEQAMLAGERGEAVAIAMGLIVALGNAGGAESLIEIESAHIDGCLYHGPVGLDFAELLASAGGLVAVPSSLNVSALDLLHPDLIRLDPETRDRARRLMDAYVQMGCEPTWTCAPYQLPDRPARGAQIAWAESNAIVFANSVLGARTGRYGDFTDICAALTGRVPYAGLHRDENRRARIVPPTTSCSDWSASSSARNRGRSCRPSSGSRPTLPRTSSRPWERRQRHLGPRRCSMPWASLRRRRRSKQRWVAWSPSL